MESLFPEKKGSDGQEGGISMKHMAGDLDFEEKERGELMVCL